MHHHFHSFLDIAELLATYDPEWILELGAGGGDNTRNLLDAGRKVVVVNDGLLPQGWECEDRLLWITGLSYVYIQKYNDIPFCIVDTDHNGWTLDAELTLLEKHMKPGGIVCIHDIQAFKDTNGFMDGYYVVKAPYPPEIRTCGLTYTGALEKHLPQWVELRRTTQSCGAIALQKPGA